MCSTYLVILENSAGQIREAIRKIPHRDLGEVLSGDKSNRQNTEKTSGNNVTTILNLMDGNIYL